MALTANEITVIIERLESSLATAASSERFQDQEITWASTSELLERINYYKDMLAGVDGTATTARTRFVRMSTDSGYGY